MTAMTVNGVELYYEREGAGDRIALTHGAWTDSRTWRQMVDRLADRFEVVTWDRRGHSRSEDGPPGGVRQDAADLAALIEGLGDGPVHLVGNSSGGAVVLNLLASRPELAASAAVHEPGPLVLLEGSDDPEIVSHMEKDRGNVARVTDMIARGEHRRAAQYFLDEVAIGPGAWEGSPQELRDVLEANARTALDDLREAYQAETVDMEALGTTRVPLLVSLGTESPPMESAAARELARRVPARLEAVAGAGHIPHRTHPDDYVALLTAFIDGVGAGASVTAQRRQA